MERVTQYVLKKVQSIAGRFRCRNGIECCLTCGQPGFDSSCGYPSQRSFCVVFLKAVGHLDYLKP